MKVLGAAHEKKTRAQWPKKFVCCGKRILAERSDATVALFSDDYSGSDKTAWLVLECPLCGAKHKLWPEEYRGDRELEGKVLREQYRYVAEKTAARRREGRW